MSTSTEEKIYKELRDLKKETKALKELLFLVMRDREGEYKASFVARAHAKSRIKPKFVFTTKEDFLRQITA